jgi:hypothetical protein
MPVKPKKILLAFFVKKKFVNSILSYLKDIEINENDIFIYEINENDIEYLFSVSFEDVNTNKLSNHKFIKPMHVHIKNGCLFSINALNTYIRETNPNMEQGNINYNSINIDWSLLKNKLLLVKNNQLSLNDFKKIKI